MPKKTLILKPIREDSDTYIKRKNLVRLMRERAMDREELAQRYKCTPAYIYQLEMGLVGIGAKALNKLAQIFKVSMDEFLVEDPEASNIEADLMKSLEDLMENLKNHPEKMEILEHLKRQIHLLKKVK